MDLFAYSQIDSLEKIMKDNGIEIPRLRGLRLMSEEHTVSENEIAEAVKSNEKSIHESAVTSIPRFRPDSGWHRYSPTTDLIKKKYLIRKKITEIEDGKEYSYNEIIGFRWDLIHGKNRKELKFALKKGRAAVIKNLTTFNKYVGRKDVLYVHARIGGDNWSYYGGNQIEKQPWFLEKVDDYFDRTYCDIYVKIKENNYESNTYQND